MQQRSPAPQSLDERDTGGRATPHVPARSGHPDHPALRPVECIDLDTGLIRTDLLIEQVLQLLKHRPYLLLLLPYWWLRGRAVLAREIARRAPVDPAALPFDQTRLEAVRRAVGAAAASGTRLVAVTSLDRQWAEPIARHLGFILPVVASDDGVRLRGAARQARLDAEFGSGGYRWRADEPDRAPPVRAAALARIRPYIKALRPHQWLKNALVFVPIVLAVKSLSAMALVHGAIAVLAFSLAASSVYVLNDLTDLADDRRHPTKRRRPLASGLVPLNHGLAMVPVLLAAAVLVSLLTLPLAFTGVLLVYYAVTLAYSFVIKRTMLFDVITLAGLYTMRIIAGSAAVAIPRSFWLLAFSVFLFFSLALVKRYVEIKDIVDAAAEPGGSSAKADPAKSGDLNGKIGGRGYRAVDLETLSQFGISSGLMAVLVLALYIDSSVVKSLYRSPELIWLLCPLMLYLICRFWILARRGEMHDDPIVFAARDWRSQLIVAAGALLLLVAALV